MSTKDEPAELDQDVARREKYRKLGEAGVPLFPYTAARTHEVAEVVAAFAGLTAAELEEKKAGRRRPRPDHVHPPMGRATFFHISDGRQQLQAYVREDKVGAEAYERFALFDLGDVVSVSGTLFKTRTGELTVLCDAVTFLAKCLHPLPEKWHGLQDVELRYRQRYLDLIMNPEVGEVFRLRSAIVAHIRRFFDARGYVEVETPMMHPIPGGALARPFKTFHNALGHRALPPHRPRALPQAPGRRRPATGSTRSTGASATRASTPSTTPSSRCSSSTRPTRTTST